MKPYIFLNIDKTIYFSTKLLTFTITISRNSIAHVRNCHETQNSQNIYCSQILWSYDGVIFEYDSRDIKLV